MHSHVANMHPHIGPRSHNKKIVESMHPQNKKIFNYSTTNTSIHGSKCMQRVLHHVRDAVVSGNTSDIPLNNLEHIDGIW